MATFCLSWQLYAVFPLYAIFILLLIHNFDFLKKNIRYLSINVIARILFFSILGYITGHFNFVDQPIETFKGIFLNKTRSTPISQFFYDGKPIWDHVNSTSFDEGVILVPFFVFTLLAFPFLHKNNKVAIFMHNIVYMGLFLIFIRFFSYGYLWHAFPFSLYWIVFIFYTFSNISLESFKKVQYSILLIFIIGLSAQFVNLSFYIKNQLISFCVTEAEIMNLEKYKNVIYDDIYNFSLTLEENPRVLITDSLKRKSVKEDQSIMCFFPSGYISVLKFCYGSPSRVRKYARKNKSNIEFYIHSTLLDTIPYYPKKRTDLESYEEFKQYGTIKVYYRSLK